MRESFKGWKPKAGCVTLLVACVFAVGCMSGDFDIIVELPATKIAEGVYRERLWVVPLWPIVASLTLLSAYLLLSTPRPPKRSESN